MDTTGTTPTGGKPFSFGLQPRPLVMFATLLASVPLLVIVVPWMIREAALALGWMLRQGTEGRRSQLAALMDDDDKKYREQNKEPKPNSTDEDHQAPHTNPRAPGDADEAHRNWDGSVGFFHPFCNAGGGGERVLWAAIRATQIRWPKAKCVVYTGDHDVNKDAILQRVESRFNIHLHPPTITFLYLSKRDWVLATTWPHFTLLGQSLGSMILAWDAFSLLVPDIFVDTMGYAFALGLCKLLFRNVPTGAYVHYPTISTDMLESLDPTSSVGSQGVNAGQGTGIRGKAKRVYWQLFARLYSWVGSSIDVVMTNSTWTQSHVQTLWGPYRRGKRSAHPIAVVYPPVAVLELEQEVEVSEASEKKREQVLVYIAQFRPEKNHPLVLQSFAEFLKTNSQAANQARLVLIGSVRDDHDSKRVYQLRLLANELGIKDRVEFHLDASWPEILEWLRKASVGVNGMWNEHFGIGVVEYQAAGLISVVHDSGGPKLDIVVEVDGEPTGYHATTAQEFAAGYEKALSHPDPLAIRKRARTSAMRFTEEEFARGWLLQMSRLVGLKK
ncbi:glycosyl transferases group 1 domain-containing protein [Hirsutella rhossiliensis]|uniref:GDP-Man:Man(3)GlcNAc(2)-PP-Dol alpha-1,2-mannosyltransferase n=1 Tax=Hirsutella rhossiliensis TaxID=111463 RepID=A0A9P8MTE0_9HYPO|nr:glycosyl transferases group 1 domain-containing protein [Hirsutella rhossiliensis]KAH0960742.1 glycosyl transferases group 1 domain-containing protein [Hirsutella rhossiliensis]